MSLTSVTFYEITTIKAVGKYDNCTAQFVSDQPLTSQLLSVDLGLFIPGNQGSSSLTAWQLTYPSSPGVYDMSYQGPQSSRNYRVELEVVDSLTFKIHAYFMFRADTGGYVSQGLGNNPESFTTKHFGSLSGVYDDLAYLTIKAGAGGSYATFYRPYNANWFNEDNIMNYALEIGGVETNGYVVGQNLTINFNINTDLADAGYDVAIIRTDSIPSGGNFISAHNLHYGRVVQDVSQVDELNADAFVSAKPLNSLVVPGYSFGQVVIDGSHFVDGAIYQVYVVYKVLGVEFAVKTADIEASTIETQYDPVYGSVACSAGQLTCANISVVSSFIGDPNEFTNDYQVKAILPSGVFSPIASVTAFTDGPVVGITSFTDTVAQWDYSGPILGATQVTLVITLDNGAVISAVAPIQTFPGTNYNNVEVCAFDAIETCCIENICPGESSRFCVQMDEAEYNAAATAAGVNGTFEDNFVGVTAGVVDSLGAPPFSFDQGLTVTPLSNGGCVDLTIPNEWQNSTKYIVFVFQFDLGTHMDYIYKPMRFTVGQANLSAAVVAIRDEDNNLLPVLCNEETGQLTVFLQGDFEGCDSLEVLIGLEGSDSYSAGPVTVQNVTATSAEAVIDLSLLGNYEDQAYCLRLRCIQAPIDGPESCEGECFDMSLTQTTLSGGNNAVMRFEFTVPDDVESFQITTNTGASALLTGPTGSFDFNVATYGPEISVQYTIIAVRGGCIFTSSLIMSTYNQTADATTVEYNICNAPPESSCNNYIGIITDCDPSGGYGNEQIYATAALDGATNIDTTTFEYSLNGVDGWAAYTGGTPLTATFAAFRLTVTFTDGCPDLVAQESVTCLGNSVQFCNNQPELSECIFDADAQTLIVNDIGTYTSEVLDPLFAYSLDAGETWLTVDGPISTAGFTDGQVVMFRINPIYADNCNQGPEVFKECVYNEGVTTCDYSAFSLACEVNDSTFTPTFGGDETGLAVSVKEFSENGGASWDVYNNVPVTSASQTVLWRWELQYPGCDTFVLVVACTKECSVEFPDNFNVTITNPSLTVDIPECIGVYDCIDACNAEAGTPTDGEICAPAFPA